MPHGLNMITYIGYKWMLINVTWVKYGYINGRLTFQLMLQFMTACIPLARVQSMQNRRQTHPAHFPENLKD